jgi:ketosteroid isomerase-like protein
MDEDSVQRLLDERAIERIIRSGYPFPMDAGDLDGVADTFRHATLIFEAANIVISGRDAIREFWPKMTSLYEDNTQTFTRHYVTNTVVDLTDDGGKATARSYYLTTQCVPERFPLQVILSGEYHDQFEKVDAVWRLTERRFTRMYFGDLSFHAPSASEWDVPS